MFSVVEHVQQDLILLIANKLLCEAGPAGNCLEMQLNDAVNYVRYHLVTLLEKMKQEKEVKT